MDRLVDILLNIFFPFYSEQEFSGPRPNPALVNRIHRGFDIWSSGNIYKVPDCEHPTVQLTIVQPYAIRGPNSNGETVVKAYVGLTATGSEYCTCPGFAAHGKRCSHLWAFANMRLCGPIEQYERRTMRVAEVLIKNQSAQESSGPDQLVDVLPEQDVDTEEYVDDYPSQFEQYWGQSLEAAQGDWNFPLRGPTQTADVITYAPTAPLLLEPPPSHPTSAVPSQGPPPFAASIPPATATSGRPPNVTPLQPRRTRRIMREERDAQLLQRMAPGGAVNLGNQCYVLSLLQVLSKLPFFRRTFQTATSTRPVPAWISAVNQFFVNVDAGRVASYANLVRQLSSEWHRMLFLQVY